MIRDLSFVLGLAFSSAIFARTAALRRSRHAEPWIQTLSASI
jgi:hypothetical protein